MTDPKKSESRSKDQKDKKHKSGSTSTSSKNAKAAKETRRQSKQASRPVSEAGSFPETAAEDDRQLQEYYYERQDHALRHPGVQYHRDQDQRSFSMQKQFDAVQDLGYGRHYTSSFTYSPDLELDYDDNRSRR